jgi:hypothetical protein
MSLLRSYYVIASFPACKTQHTYVSKGLIWYTRWDGKPFYLQLNVQTGGPSNDAQQRGSDRIQFTRILRSDSDSKNWFLVFWRLGTTTTTTTTTLVCCCCCHGRSFQRGFPKSNSIDTVVYDKKEQDGGKNDR